MTQVISILFWAVTVPFCIGLIPAKFMQDERKSAGTVFLAGFFLMWSVFELITIPCVLWVTWDNFLIASRIFTIVSLVMAVLGIILYVKGKYKISLGIASVKSMSWETRIFWALFLIVLGFQLYMALARTSFDGDDAYYVVQSLMSQQTGAMYKNHPYTGRSVDLDVRHALAVFPMWIAFLSVRAGIHATITSHTVMPLIIIPLAYLVYGKLSDVIFPEKKENRPVFLIFVALLQIFGNVSIYTNETFFLTRTWQGKSVAGSIIIPAVIWAVIWTAQTAKESLAPWFILIFVNMSAGMMSSIASFLAAMLVMLFAFCILLVKKDWKQFINYAVCCIPNGIYALLYLLIR